MVTRFFIFVCKLVVIDESCWQSIVLFELIVFHIQKVILNVEVSFSLKQKVDVFETFKVILIYKSAS